MQQFILEEQLEVICDEESIAWEEVQELAKEDFILVMLRIRQGNSSRKWRQMIKNAKIENVIYLWRARIFNISKILSFG